MAKEYVIREDVINDIGELFTICRETLPNECGHHFIVESELQSHLDFVRNLPAADVVEVVRCRDCPNAENYYECKQKLALQAADAIEELSRAVSVWAKRAMAWAEKAEEAHRWIPVTKAPALKVGDEGYPGYLVYANGYYDVADYTVDRLGNGPSFHVDGEYEPDITHYMPLPEPPKENGKSET